MKTNNIEKRNREKGKYCKGCAWRHIGIDVGHNHCDYNDREEWNELERRVNGQLSYIKDGKGKVVLLGLSERCRWFWDGNSEEKPTKKGLYYSPPKGSYEKCPKIPLRLSK